jgi:hypothetical protein
LFKRDKKDRKTFLIYRTTKQNNGKKGKERKRTDFSKNIFKGKEKDEKNRFSYNHRKDLPLSIVVDV